MKIIRQHQFSFYTVNKAKSFANNYNPVSNKLIKVVYKAIYKYASKLILAMRRKLIIQTKNITSLMHFSRRNS